MSGCRVATGWAFIAYPVTGNPFAFPLNTVFALRHGVPLGRYDRAVGPYLLDERVSTTNPLLPPKRTETVPLSEPWALAFLGRGFEQTPTGAVLRHGVGEFFVPLNRPGSLELNLAIDGEAAGALAWAFNGHRTAGPQLHIEASWVERGINILRVEAGGVLSIRELTLTEGPEWPPAWATEYMP